MKTLIVGAGALGGLIATRMRVAGAPVWLATRDRETAEALQAGGLKVTGVGGAGAASADPVAPIDDYPGNSAFDLIVLATKAREAIAMAPKMPRLLAPGGTLLPIQNGGVSQLLAEALGGTCVLGGLSNFGATMTAPGVYEQGNAGNFLIGELAGGESARAEQIRGWLGRGVEMRVTANIEGAIWSKLLLNCSVTTLGAVAGQPMRQYIAMPAGGELFSRTYDEALSVALASGARPERMIVDPVPPTWSRAERRSAAGEAYQAWLAQILKGYGDLKASMLQDFERGRTTEIDFINGYVANLGPGLGVPTPLNSAIVNVVHAITRGEAKPHADLLERILQAGREENPASGL